MRRLALFLVMALGVAACGSDGAVESFERGKESFERGKTSAQDRLATAELRNAFAAEKVFFTDHQQYTESLDEIRAIEPALTYAVGAQPAQVRTIYVKAEGLRLHLSTRSGSGRCYYIRADGNAETGYAVDTACGPAAGQQYAASW